MEIIGFVFLVISLAGASFGWVLALLYDGRFGERDVPLLIMGMFFIVLACLWSLLINNAPFSIVAG